MTTPSFRSRAAFAALSSICAAAQLTAQVTDPAVFSPYGSECGLSLTADDTIFGRPGEHRLQFSVAGAAAGAPTALALGSQQVDWAFPGLACSLYTNFIATVPATADGLGNVDYEFTAPANATQTFTFQALSLAPQPTLLEASGGIEAVFPGMSPTVDPTTDRTVPCYYFGNYVLNHGGDGIPSVTGRIYFPSTTCSFQDGPPPGSPVVIFMHGNDMSHTDHDEIMRHLAFNGFVAASIANGGFQSGTNEGRARQAISFLNGMRTVWSLGGQLGNDVVFMGHSRGGEAAVTAARLLHEQPSLGHIAYDVEAVVSIAPTDGGGHISDPRESLTGAMAEGFLAIYGSHDPDVRGIRLEDPLVAPEETAFAIYDRAGSEFSREGLLFTPPLTKAFVYVHGANHKGFEDSCTPFAPGSVSCATHTDIAKAYTNAFLRWRVFGQNEYRAYFDGTARPTTLRLEDDLVLQQQFDDGGKRVIDNFEQGGVGTNTAGGTVLVGSGIAAFAEDELWQIDATSPNDTRGMRIKWSNSNSSFVRWNIPGDSIPLVGPRRDVSSYDYLSVRVAQNYLDAWNTPDEDQDFYLRLFSSSGYSTDVPVSDFGRVPYAPAFIHHPYPYPAGDYSKSAMSTIRVPLSAFGNVDLTTVTRVYMIFDVPGHEIGSINVDSLEFVR